MHPSQTPPTIRTSQKGEKKDKKLTLILCLLSASRSPEFLALPRKRCGRISTGKPKSSRGVSLPRLESHAPSTSSSASRHVILRLLKPTIGGSLGSALSHHSGNRDRNSSKPPVGERGRIRHRGSRVGRVGEDWVGAGIRLGEGGIRGYDLGGGWRAR